MFPSHFHVADFGIFAVVAVFALIVVLISLIDWRKSQKGSSIPGPDPSDPELGNLGDLQKAGSLHQYMLHLHKTYGPIASFWWGNIYTVSVACPHLWKDIQSLFDRPPELFKLMAQVIGEKNVFYINGKEGRKTRQVMDRSFSHDAISNYYDCFRVSADRMAEEWSSFPHNQHIPVMENMLYLSISCIGRAGLGLEDENDVKRFGEAFEMCWYDIESQIEIGAAPHDPGSVRGMKFESAKKYMRTVIKNLIQTRRKELKDVTNRLFIDSMIEYHQADEDKLEDEIISLMIGGFQTTASLMTWCIYYLAVHPEIQEKVYQELVEVLGEEDIQPLVAGELKYCRQVLDETLRCAVLAPWGARVQVDHDLQIGEYVVPKQTPILTPFGVVLQDPEIFPEPRRFDPDRFSPENSKDRPSLAYQPFGFAGKRKCPGWRFSITEGLVFLSVFFRRFNVKLVEGQRVEPVYRSVTCPKEEVWITISKR